MEEGQAGRSWLKGVVPVGTKEGTKNLVMERNPRAALQRPCCCSVRTSGSQGCRKAASLRAAPTMPRPLVHGWHTQDIKTSLTALARWRGRGRRHQDGCVTVQLLQALMELATAAAPARGWQQKSMPSKKRPRAVWSPPKTKGQLSSV